MKLTKRLSRRAAALHLRRVDVALDDIRIYGTALPRICGDRYSWLVLVYASLRPTSSSQLQLAVGEAFPSGPARERPVRACRAVSRGVVQCRVEATRVHSCGDGASVASRRHV